MNGALPLRPAAALVVAALLAAACSSGQSSVEAPEPSPSTEDLTPNETAPAVDGEAASEEPSGSAESAVSQPSSDVESADAGSGESGSAGSDDGDASAPTTDAECPEELQGLGLTCSLVTVPVDRDDPAAGTIDTSVVVRRGTGDGSLPPLAVLQGGPGGASSDLALFLPSRPYAQVFIDQRGAGFGSADFTCHELREVLPEVLEAPRVEALRVETEALGRCADRLADHPALAHTTTAAHAADVADVMDALGYDRWLVYGVSYGTTIALEVLRDAPSGLMGAVLDGVYPSTLDLDRDIALAAERVLAELDAACVVDPSCAAILADSPTGDGASLSGLLSELIDSINELPIVITLSASQTTVGERLDVWIDGDSVASLVFQMLYADYLTALVPALLAGLAREDGTAGGLLALVGVEIAAESAANSAFGTYFAVTCAEWLPFTSGPPEAVDDFAAAVVGEGVAQGCDPWTERPPPLPAAEPVESDLPVLLVSGRFDPITPPIFADEAAEHLSAATHVVSGVRGHGIWVWGIDNCVDRIVDDFLADPGSSLDIACASDERPLRWQRRP